MARIALFQSRTGIDPAANAEALVEAIGAASEGGAEMLFTPEMSGLLDRDAARAASKLRAEQDDEVLAACRDAAKANGLWVHIGSLAVRTEDGKLANRAFLIDPDGSVRARYDRIHLFDVDLPTGESWRESAVYRPGAGVVVVDGTPVGRLGLSICYDLRFPALFARLAEAGALAFMVGCDEADFPAVEAVIAPMSRATIRGGDPGAVHMELLYKALSLRKEAVLAVLASKESAHAGP